MTEARELVKRKRPEHIPIWQLHAGTKEWIERLTGTSHYWGCIEYDVADCFLNTPRGADLEAIEFWCTLLQHQTCKQPCFAISKDGKKGDHRGRPTLLEHYHHAIAANL